MNEEHEDILIKNGNIHDGNGNIFYSTDILVKDGKIKQIAKEIELNEDIPVYDATDKVVLPGFIESLNIWGCTGPGWGDNDLEEHSDPITPQMNVVYSFDQDNMMFQRVFEYGITSAGITPGTSNVLGGYAAVFKTFGDHPYKMLIKEKVGVVGSVSRTTTTVYKDRNMAPMTKMGTFSLLREYLKKAEAYSTEMPYDSKLISLKDVVEKKTPLFINCNTNSEIVALNHLLKDFDVDLVLTGAYGVNENILNMIIDNKLKIIFGDVTNGMSAASQNLNFDVVRELINKNVPISISSTGDRMSSGKESLLWNAILFYKNGINSSDVLKMITSNAAKILSVDDRIGSIEPGKDADIVVWTNNPIESYDSKAEAVFINGKNVLGVWRMGSCW
jgi:imidazolonepropionase-like amidohydrolase